MQQDGPNRDPFGTQPILITLSAIVVPHFFSIYSVAARWPTVNLPSIPPPILCAPPSYDEPYLSHTGGASGTERQRADERGSRAVCEVRHHGGAAPRPHGEGGTGAATQQDNRQLCARASASQKHKAGASRCTTVCLTE